MHALEILSNWFVRGACAAPVQTLRTLQSADGFPVHYSSRLGNAGGRLYLLIPVMNADRAESEQDTHSDRDSCAQA